MTILIALISLYRRFLSPDHSWISRLYPNGFCRFYPTCSVYTCEALQKYGIVRGGLQSIGRLARCHPWSSGGIDHVKEH